MTRIGIKGGELTIQFSENKTSSKESWQGRHYITTGFEGLLNFSLALGNDKPITIQTHKSIVKGIIERK